MPRERNVSKFVTSGGWRRSVFKTVQALMVIAVSLFHQQKFDVNAQKTESKLYLGHDWRLLGTIVNACLTAI
jgi:hypothetical protein